MTFLELSINENSLQGREILFLSGAEVNAFTYPINIEETPTKWLIAMAEKAKELFPQITGVVLKGGTIGRLGRLVWKIGEDQLDLKIILGDLLNLPVITASDCDGQKVEVAFAKQQEYYCNHIEYYGLETGKKELSKESLLTVGNGLFGLRGAFVEGRASDDVYPATYVAGGYNQLSGAVGDKMVTNEDFVNLPNGQFLTFRVGKGEYLAPEKAMVQEVFRSLDLRNGTLTTSMIVDLDGKQARVVCQKTADMKRRHYYGISYQIYPLNFSGEIEVYSEIDGTVENQGVERYKALPSRHLRTVAVNNVGNIACLQSTTIQSEINILEAARLTGSHFNENDVVFSEETDKAIQKVCFSVIAGECYHIEKIVALFTSLETTGNLMEKAIKELTVVPDFADLLAESSEAWAALWQKSDIQVTGDLLSQKLLRLHIYHLLVSVSPMNNIDLDFSIGARGLHGEAYRGHIFWDELFIYPFYALHYPTVSKQLLMYRYNRLEAAKQSAAAEGYQGAMYPWQSGRDGDEQSQLLHLNPLTGHWGEDASRLQRHVGLSIAYNVWYYWHLTEDREFMSDFGLEMLIEIARFFKSKAKKNEISGRYDIDKVMGPDEFHEAYPKAESAGLKNNAYTNVMTAWLFRELENILTSMDDNMTAAVLERTGFSMDERAMMADIRKNLKLEINEDGIISQYEGYFQLKEVEWDAYSQKYGNIYRMDRLLKAEGKSADEYKVAKQPDTLMMFYSLGKETVDAVLTDLGYQLPIDYLNRNMDYYLARTSHGSTLSRVIHGRLAKELGNDTLAWELYSQALGSDYTDIQGGTTAEGIHTGVMAATVAVAIDTFGGADVTGEYLKLNPSLPERFQSLSFQILFKGVTYNMTVTHQSVMIKTDQDSEVEVKGKRIQLQASEENCIYFKEESK